MKLPFALPLYKKTRLLTKGFGPQYPQKGVRGQTSLAGASLHPPGGGQGTAFFEEDALPGGFILQIYIPTECMKNKKTGGPIP